jgi:anti-sigma factor RsiW
VQHGFTDSEWLALMDGNLPERSRARLMRHVASCEDCAAFLDRAREWESRIAVETKKISQALSLSEERLAELLAVTLALIREERFARFRRGETTQLAGATALLGTLLEPLLGPQITQRVIDQAAARSSASAVPEIQADTWRVFIQDLGFTVGSLCGLNTERLIDCVGRSIAAEIL